MASPASTGLSSSESLDARLRAMLREFPREHAILVEALVQEHGLRVSVAERRAERMQRLHEASSALLRTLDREELELETALQLLRLIPCDGVVLARPSQDSSEVPEIAVHVTPGGKAPADTAGQLAPVLVDVLRSGRVSRTEGRTGAPGAVMAVPVMQGYRLVAILGAYSRDALSFSDEDVEATQTLATHAATALVNSALFTQSERERRQSDVLAALAQALGGASRLPDVMRLALRHAIAQFGVEGADIALRRDDYLTVVSAEGNARSLLGAFVPVNGSVAGRAIREGRPVIVNDAAADPETFEPTRRMANARRFLIAPLLTADGATGVMSLVNRERPFDAEDARMVQQFAAQVAVAVVNARLYDEAEDAKREITAAFEAIGDGIAVLSPDATIVRANAKFLELTGLPSAEGARGRQFYDALLHEYRDLTENCAVGQAILEGRPARAQLRSAWNGRVLDILAAPDAVGGAVVSVSDVTEVHLLSERHRLVVENITDAILVTSADGDIEFANRAAQRLFGEERPLTGLGIASLMPEDESTVWAEALARSRRGDPARLDGSVARCDGARRLVSARLAPLVDESRVRHLIISLRDVTDETVARDETAAANARYRDLVELAADAIATLDTAGNITSLNPAAARLAGLPAEQIVGRSFESFLEPSESPEARRAFVSAQTGAPERIEIIFVGSDGRRQLLEVTFSPMRRAGAVVGVLAVVRNVTEARAQAAALSHAEARYARLVESAEDAIACVDEEGNFTAVNKALEHVTGRSRAELLGSHFQDLVEAAERPEMWRAFVAALAGERSRRTIRFTRPGGQQGFATLVTAPIVQNDVVTGVLGIARDVSEERMLLDQAIRQDRMVAMGELVGGVAHEVNSPLTSILAYAQVLERGVGGEDAAKALETITREAKRATRIVSKLLAFGRQGKPERIPSDVNQALRDTIDLRRYALRMQEIRLSVNLMADPPLVLADPFQLQQVFINLLANAEQAVAHEPGEKSITVSSSVRDGVFVVTISDNGPGIAPETLPHIFNPFFTTKPRGAGTGLGLSISDGIIREHRGALRARSVLGQGATFEVELPLSPSPTT